MATFIRCPPSRRSTLGRSSPGSERGDGPLLTRRPGPPGRSVARLPQRSIRAIIGRSPRAASRRVQQPEFPMSDSVVIVGAKRTAIGSFLGQFTGVPTPTLGAATIRAALQQSGIAPADVSEVFMGCVLPANLGQAPARQAALGAGLPVSTGCTTINKVCGSGMKAIMLGHDLIKAGSAQVVVAGGMESMTNAPHMVSARTGLRYGDAPLVDHMAWDGLTNPYDGRAMGTFAEQCVDKYSFTREEQDAFSVE